jgi:hypothetical protein
MLIDELKAQVVQENPPIKVNQLMAFAPFIMVLS